GSEVTIVIPPELKTPGLNYISSHYKLPLQVTISMFADMDECEVNFVLKKWPLAKEGSPSNIDPLLTRRFEEANLEQKYTFDTFVVGSNNKLAHAASVAVAESPGKAFNPLFIYGGAGLGKTHLIHSIAHYIIENNEDSKVLYITSENFMNELIETIRSGNSTAMSRFREKYRNIDVLLVDDIQFIVGRESTQEEFFHTFNSLRSAEKQIIMTSDKKPKDMNMLEDRFRSRFEWGLIVDITAPDYETRMAILHQKEELENFHLSEEVISYIAENITSNIRELEGAFNKLLAFSKLEKNEITLEVAQLQLMDFISPDEKKIVTFDDIISAVAEYYQISESDIKSSRRNNKFVVPRQVVMYLCREMLDNTSLKNIANYLGKKDHTTVLYAIEKIESEMQTDENLRNSIDLLKKKINPQG
ncbi:MAG: chromosomal replication initiator protein DnaA, partial [Blautia sp.]|nr:chromosomal replication initiator protein DnaA [Blautia sp.]